MVNVTGLQACLRVLVDALVPLSLVLVFTKSDLDLEDEVTQVLSRDVTSFTASGFNLEFSRSVAKSEKLHTLDSLLLV